MAREEIQSEVTGTVWKIEMKVGDAVSDGDTIMILESMKMEIPVLTEHAGRVSAVRVTPGDVVQEGDVLVSLDLT